jgi:hypothetical protein
VHNIADILPVQNVLAVADENIMTMSNMEFMLVFFDRIIKQQETNETLFCQDFIQVIGKDFTSMAAMEFRKIQSSWEEIKLCIKEIFDNSERRFTWQKDFVAVEANISELLQKEMLLWDNFIKRSKKS